MLEETNQCTLKTHYISYLVFEMFLNSGQIFFQIEKVVSNLCRDNREMYLVFYIIGIYPTTRKTDTKKQIIEHSSKSID